MCDKCYLKMNKWFNAERQHSIFFKKNLFEQKGGNQGGREKERQRKRKRGERDIQIVALAMQVGKEPRKDPGTSPCILHGGRGTLLS